MKILQKLIDIIRFKFIKQALRENSCLLMTVINFTKFFKPHNKLISIILRYLGAEVGKNFRCGVNTNIICPQNIVIGDNVWFGDNNNICAWSPITIECNTFTSCNVVLLLVRMTKAILLL